MPILILHTAWMRSYRGLANDQPIGTFAHMLEGGVPHEIYNFYPRGKFLFGYAPVRHGNINISRLGAPDGAESISNITVVWTATSPEGGRYIVGWFKNATVFARLQGRTTSEAERKILGSDSYFSVKARVNDCKLLPLDERTFFFPTRKPKFPGSSPAYYADQTLPPDWLRRLKRYLDTQARDTISIKRPPTTLGGRSADPVFRKKVEEAAVRTVTKYYRAIGYTVVSHERDNLGWDLTATLGMKVLHLEVKGLSGTQAVVEVTPNEYKTMHGREYLATYRLCIVTNTMEKPSLRIFAFDQDCGLWRDESSMCLDIVPLIGARITVIKPSRETQRNGTARGR